MPWRWEAPGAVAAAIARTLFADRDGPASGAPRSFPLAGFQEEAVRRARRILARRGGVIVADEVGLGKTYVALALVEEALAREAAVAIVVPAALKATWAPLLRQVRRACGSSARAIQLTTHARLSRGTHDAGQLAEADLVVVDEAHAFRNPATRRYRALANRRPGSQLVLITATPVNNGIADLYHLLRQFARNDAFRDIGIASLRACFLAPDRGGSDAARVAAEVVVRRTRSDISDRSAPRSAPGATRFPRRLPARVIRYDDFRTDTLVAGIEQLELAPYGTVSKPDGSGSGAACPAPGVEALLRLGLLKRLESSPAALAASLRRLRGLLFAFADAAADGRLLRPSDRIARADAADGDVVQLILAELVLEPARGTLDLDRLAASARRDADSVRGMLRMLAGTDPKRVAFERWRADRPAHEKVVVFTEFRETAAALWRAMAPAGRVGRVDGSGAWLGRRPAGRSAVVERFSPLASGVAPPPDRERVDLLIATDVLSEGVNLQDAATVVGYDLPWNPVRLLQRIGRVDRLGSRHAVVLPVLFVPGAGLDEVLRLTRSLRSKLGGIADTLGAGDAGELLEWLGGSADPGRVLNTVATPDPWERLRAAAARAQAGRDPALEGLLLGEDEPLLSHASAVTADGPAPTWLVLGRAANGPPELFEVREGRVTEAGPGAATVLERVLVEAADALPDAPGPAPGVGRRRTAPDADVSAEADAAARAVRGHLGGRAMAARAPAPLERSGSGPRLAARIRGALAAAGPDPDRNLLARTDAVLRRLAEPLDLRTRAAVDRLQVSTGPSTASEASPVMLPELLDRLEGVLLQGNGAGRADGPGHLTLVESERPITILAALRVPSPKHRPRG